MNNFLDNIKIKEASINVIHEYMETIISLEKYYFKEEAWNEEAILKELPDKFNISVVILLENKLAGYLINSMKSNTFYIHKFVVSPEHVGRGLGTFILKHIKLNQPLRAIELKVSKSNLNAIAFYRKENFEIIDENKNYYQLRFKA